MFVYIRSEPGLYTVGHYSPDGKWHAESDYASTEEAAARCHYLNGGEPTSPDNIAGAWHEYRARTGKK